MEGSGNMKMKIASQSEGSGNMPIAHRDGGIGSSISHGYANLGIM